MRDGAFEIEYEGQKVIITPFEDGSNKRFKVSLPKEEIIVYIDNIEDYQTWVEEGRGETQRSIMLGRAIKRCDEFQEL